MSQQRLAIVTEDRYEAPGQTGWYEANIELEDNLLREALEGRNFSVDRISWSRSNHDWGQYDCAVIRSTWDYFDRFAEFCRWFEQTSQETQIVNDPSIIRWNLDKRYLLELARAEVPIVPTTLLEKGRDFQLAPWIEANGEGIIKPTVSGGARHTYRLTNQNIETVQKTFSALIQQESFLLQPFIPEITSIGEVSFIVLGGRFSHAVRKVPKAGDFRVQDDFGGTVEPYTPIDDDLSFAETTVSRCSTLHNGKTPAYARVDAVKTETQRGPEWLLMELELIEPELWLRTNADSKNKLADAVVQALGANK